METAAAYAGISKDTLYAWLKRGKREKRGAYRAFSDAVASALAESEVTACEIVAKAGATDWRATAWRLERRFPDRFAPKAQVRVQVDAELSKMLDVAKGALDEAAYEQFLAALASAQGDGQAT